MRRKTVTFVCHTANRSGAPLALLHTLKQMKDVPWDVNLLLLQNGPLRVEFERLCPTEVINFPRFARRQSRALHWWQRGRRLVGANVPDLYVQYSHTYDFLHVAAAQNVPVLSYVHEVPLAFTLLSDETIALFRSYPRRVIGVSRSTTSFLETKIGIPPERIACVPAGLDCARWLQPVQGNEKRRELGIPEDALVIGAAGQRNALKGIDLWLRTCRRVMQQMGDRPCFGVWTGGIPDGGIVYAKLMEAEAARLGIADRIRFVPEKADPRDWYDACDILALSSRMETLSLVSLEYALLGKPVVAFRGTGGPDDLAELGFVSLVKEVDADAMADEVLRLMSDPEARARMRTAAHSAIPARYDIRHTSGRLVVEINKLLQTLP